MTEQGHVGENAELHALGLLEPRERLELERHISACPECLRRVGEAEEAAAQLVAPLPRVEPSAAFRERVMSSIALQSPHPDDNTLARRRLAESAPFGARMQRLEGRLAVERARRKGLGTLGIVFGALAAVFAIAFATTLWRATDLQATVNGDDVALVQLVHSHFNHVSMAPTGVATVDAKVVYAKDGSWIYVVADRPLQGLHVVARVHGVKRDFGTAEARGGVATLFVRRAGRPSDVTLLYKGVPLATATLAY